MKGNEYTVFRLCWYVIERKKSFEGSTDVAAYDLQVAVNYFKECHPQRILKSIYQTQQHVLTAENL